MRTPWKTIIWVAILLGVPSSFLVEKYPWIITLPIVVGTIIVTKKSLQNPRP
jgi:hypothetical protein